MTIKDLRKKSVNLPDEPGVYIMKNNSGEIIYIGKAKNLKNRVSSYFGSQKNHSIKVKQMVSGVNDFDYIITDSEFEALVLECNLIKKEAPKYNILLKDDKGYSYIRVSKEKFPRISEVKQIADDGATYFGPYMSSRDVKTCVDEACKIFKISRCNKNFARKEFKQRACLNYYINQCSAPCIGKISQQDYAKQISEAIEFLRNGSEKSIENLTEKMMKFAAELNFEQASVMRDRIAAIKTMAQKQKVVNLSVRTQDVISCVVFGGKICFEVFNVRSGDLCGKESFIFDEPINLHDAIVGFIQQYYMDSSSVPAIINLNEELENVKVLQQWFMKFTGKKVNIRVPKRAVQKKLLDMCTNNAEENLLRELSGLKRESISEQLQKCLGLSKVPSYIEAYDISNLAGTDNVAGMVVFVDGRPLKQAYRRFKVKTVIGQDDYKSMAEVIERRFARYEKNTPGFDVLPDLILLDGGVGHVHVVKDLLVKIGYASVPVFGMAKDDNHKTKVLVSMSGQIDIRPNRKLFEFITKVQDEVHRFAVSYHRISKKKNTLNTELMNIKGIGKIKANALLKEFGSLEKVSESSIEELKKVDGVTLTNAHAIKDYFEKQKDSLY